LRVDHDVERGESWQVVGVHHLDVRDGVAAPADAVGPSRRGERVERLADRTIADGVHVHAEAQGVEPRHGLIEQVRRKV
jgi:hypothetical protein